MNNFMNVTQKNIKQTNVKTNNTKSSNKTENGTAIVMAGKETDKNLFLKLLVAQISHQDPMNPQDPTQYITQLAQFNTLEQMQNLNNSMGNIEGLTNGVLENLAMGTASSMIGKHIEAYDPDEININEIRKTKDILTAILTAEKKVLYLPVYKIPKYGYYQILSHTSQI